MNFSILPIKLLVEILLLVGSDELNNFNFILFHSLGLTDIKTKTLQKKITDNHIFIEYKNHKLSPKYLFFKTCEVFSMKKDLNLSYFKILVSNMKLNFSEYCNENSIHVFQNKYVNFLRVLLLNKYLNAESVLVANHDTNTKYLYDCLSLVYAAKHRECEVFKLILLELKLGYLCNDSACVCEAIERGNSKIVKLMISYTTKLVRYGSDIRRFKNAFNHACKHRYYKIIKLLLNNSQISPILNIKYSIELVSTYRDCKIMSMLLKDKRVTFRDINAAVKIILEDMHKEYDDNSDDAELKILNTLLSNKKCYIINTIDTADSFLKVAIKNGNITLVSMLLKTNIDPSENDNEAIRLALSLHHTDIAKLLLKDMRVKKTIDINVIEDYNDITLKNIMSKYNKKYSG